jgi:hypothetical protein
VQCQLCGEWFRLLGSSHLRRTHGWTLAQYREAFRLPVKVATCSRDLSLQHSTHATSQIESSSGFGKGVGVPVALRGPVRVPRWRSLAARPDLVSELHAERNPTVENPAAIASDSRLANLCYVKLPAKLALCGLVGRVEHQAVGVRAAGSGFRVQRPRDVWLL